MFEFFAKHSTAIVFSLIAGAIFGIGLIGILYQWGRMRHWTATAQAKVYKIEERETGEGTNYRTRAHFRFADDVYHVVGSWVPENFTHVVGKEVTVYFPPGHPEQAVISRLHQVLPYVAIFLIGIAALGMTIYLSLT